MSTGWEESAAAWIADMGETGDFGRAHVLDAPMLARVRARGFKRALDVGCGEGRFCRLLQKEGIAAIGIDPTEALLDAARRRDPAGDYRLGRAESLDFPAGSFDLVVSYLTLIDIADLPTALAEMTRVLRPGGTLLIANLTSFATAGEWQGAGGAEQSFVIDRYLEERGQWQSWRGIRVWNWHRPLGTYMSALLNAGLVLRHFSEPECQGGDPGLVERYRRVPWFLVMEWEKPAG
jgi:SAM-dependent methyltransferase